MPQPILITPLRIWLAMIAAAPAWVASVDPRVRHIAHRWIGREFKRAVLALGGCEVERRASTGHPRGAMPMTSSVYEIDTRLLAQLDRALRGLAARIRGRA
jgi:hypothetical protein